MKKMLSVVGIISMAVAGSSAPAWAGYDTPSTQVPGPYYSSGDTVIYANPQFAIRNLTLSHPTSSLPSPAPGSTIFPSSFFDVFVELSIDGGQTWLPETSAGASTMRVTGQSPSQFDTEMLQLDISGGSLPGGVRIRESPTLQSLGHRTMINNGNGTFHIDSFFDVFTELSLDGGASWIPSTSSTHLTENPEPGTVGLLGLGAMGLLRRRRRA